MQTDETFHRRFFRGVPIIGILRGQEMRTCLSVAEAVAEAGLTALEVTMNTPAATEIIAAIGDRFPSLTVGAGTVCTPDDLERALSAGARFIVTPILDEAVVRRCVEGEVPVFPGAYTPTEIYRAWTLGATAVKVFPASQLGIPYLRDLRGPLPQIRLVPTGGVSLENVGAYLRAGAFAVGMGSSLLRNDLIAAGNYNELRKHLSSVRSEVPD